MPRPRFDRLAYREPRPSPAIIHTLGWLNHHMLLPHVLKLRTFDLPAGDLERLRSTVRPGVAAFLAPNHPEFMTDWLIDKEISRRVSPLMAHWASYEVVNIHPAAQWLWLRNNLIANAPGGDGRAYSMRWARAGHGVLLHPEGAPSWCGDRVGPLVPGVVQMAWETARALAGERSTMPVHVVPLVWKLHFRGDVGVALGREMAHIERALGLRRAPGLSPAVERRFAELQKAVLARSVERTADAAAGPGASDITDATFFERQEAFASSLLALLESGHGRTEGDFRRRVHGLRRAIIARAAVDAEAARRDRRDRRMLAEIERLNQFTSDSYGGPTLTQEQIAESLKQLRLAGLTRGLREAVHGFLPVAVAPRTVRVRVAEPIDVREALVRGGDADAAQSALLAQLRSRLQDALHRLNAEIAPEVDPCRRPNPFHAAGPAANIS